MDDIELDYDPDIDDVEFYGEYDNGYLEEDDIFDQYDSMND